jgi:DNA-binding CsgD family transcriptional regulator
MPPADSTAVRLHALEQLLDGPLLGSLKLLPIPAWIADVDGVVRWMNGAAVALLGDRVGARVRRAAAPGGGETKRARVAVGNGTSELELASSPLRSGAATVGVLSVVRGGTARQAARGKEPRPRLTPRQRQVLELLARGRSTRQIASDLEIAEETARNHVRLLLTELRVHTRLEAVVAAYRNDWL